MLEGVIRMADMSAGDAMVAAPRMDLLSIDAPFDELLHQVIDTAHSRFPVYEDDRENIIGILMAKDLLKLQRAPELNIRALLRPAVFVPESKGLNDLLRQFRDNRQHLAIVIDEFGRTAGLITIEDVLEEIVGEIEDEFDIEEEAGDIFGLADQTYRVSGDTSLERVSEAFNVKLNPDVADEDTHQFDTIGGLVAHEMGHVPMWCCTRAGAQCDGSKSHPHRHRKNNEHVAPGLVSLSRCGAWFFDGLASLCAGRYAGCHRPVLGLLAVFQSRYIGGNFVASGIARSAANKFHRSQSSPI